MTQTAVAEKGLEAKLEPREYLQLAKKANNWSENIGNVTGWVNDIFVVIGKENGKDDYFINTGTKEIDAVCSITINKNVNARYLADVKAIYQKAMAESLVPEEKLAESSAISYIRSQSQ